MIPTSESRTAKLLLVAILAVAAALRFATLPAGVPFNIGVDEPQVLNRSVAMMRTGDFNPHFFDYPTLYIYLQLITACVTFMVGAMLGYWKSLAEVTLPDFLLWGRAVTALIGTLTVLLVYRIGLRWSVRHALLAAVLMAVIPMHVRESHFVLTDVPLTFFVALTWLMALRAGERGDLRSFACAGAAAGLAAATKYPGALALVLPLTTAWLSRDARTSRGTAAMATIAASAVTFLVAAPYTLLDLPGFLNGFGQLMGSYTKVPAGDPGWVVYLKHLRLGVGWPGYIAIHAGCVIAIVRAARGPDRRLWLLAVAFPLIYFFFISRQTLIFGRYLLPILPFVCVLATAPIIALSRLVPKLPMRRQLRVAAGATLMAVVAAPPAFTAVSFNIQRTQVGTAELAYRWIHEHVPPGTLIAVEGTDLVLHYSPYRLRQMAQLRLRRAEDYAAAGVSYLVASSQCYGPYLASPDVFKEPYAEYMALFAGTREVARFAPTGDSPGAELRILKVVP